MQAFVRRPDGDLEIPVRRPDGDVELQDVGSGFVVPPCPRCGGILKPDVVFFGDGVPPDRSERCAHPPLPLIFPKLPAEACCCCIKVQ
jgi:hypothetical protein